MLRALPAVAIVVLLAIAASTGAGVYDDASAVGGYQYAVTYEYPGPLPCTSGVNDGCSRVVDAGRSLGVGRFCDYVVVCAGATVTIFYNSFQRAG